MFWDCFDDDFFDDTADFGFIGAAFGLVEEEYDKEERLLKQLEEDSEDNFP